jgi:hypothetical protein
MTLCDWQGLPKKGFQTWGANRGDEGFCCYVQRRRSIEPPTLRDLFFIAATTFTHEDHLGLLLPEPLFWLVG